MGATMLENWQPARMPTAENPLTQQELDDIYNEIGRTSVSIHTVRRLKEHIRLLGAALETRTLEHQVVADRLTMEGTMRVIRWRSLADARSDTERRGPGQFNRQHQLMLDLDNYDTVSLGNGRERILIAKEADGKILVEVWQAEEDD